MCVCSDRAMKSPWNKAVPGMTGAKGPQQAQVDNQTDESQEPKPNYEGTSGPHTDPRALESCLHPILPHPAFRSPVEHPC